MAFMTSGKILKVLQYVSMLSWINLTALPKSCLASPIEEFDEEQLSNMIEQNLGQNVDIVLSAKSSSKISHF